MTLSLECLMPLLEGSTNSWQRCGHMMVTTWTSRWCLMDMRYVPDERLPEISLWAYVPLFYRFQVEEEYFFDTRKLAVATPKVQTTLNLRAIWLCKLTIGSVSIKFLCKRVIYEKQKEKKRKKIDRQLQHVRQKKTYNSYVEIVKEFQLINWKKKFFF